MSGASKSLLTLEDVDIFLDKLCHFTKEDEQVNHFSKFCRKCTANDLKTVSNRILFCEKKKYRKVMHIIYHIIQQI